jgi:hypothetical protein
VQKESAEVTVRYRERVWVLCLHKVVQFVEFALACASSCTVHLLMRRANLFTRDSRAYILESSVHDADIGFGAYVHFVELGRSSARTNQLQ